MNDVLTGLIMLLVGVLTLVGLGTMGFGIYIALFTTPEHDVTQMGRWLGWVGMGSMAAGLLMVLLLLGHFMVWAVR